MLTCYLIQQCAHLGPDLSTNELLQSRLQALAAYIACITGLLNFQAL